MIAPVERTIADIRTRIASWRGGPARIALVPTMGALHDGHLALVDRARSLADAVVVSVFVNPTQFAPDEDFESYPRDLEGDLAKLNQRADAVFAPVASEMYPAGHATTIHVGGPSMGLEGDSRPHFFDGVATVVAKLFLAVGPDVAVFGEKDYQQLLVIRQLVADLRLPIEVAAAPTVRESDGLALSSRNAYLDSDQRRVAPVLNASIVEAASAIAGGGDPDAALQAAQRRLERGGFVVDYVALRDAETLAPVTADDRGPSRILAAARLGSVRLIDNVGV